MTINLKNLIDKNLLALFHKQLNIDGVKVSNIEDWQSVKYYPIGRAVTYNSTLYKCRLNHTSTTTFDSKKWIPISVETAKDVGVTDWSPSTSYKVGNMITYDGKLYKCIKDNTSSASFDTDVADWQLIGGAGGASEWEISTGYEANQLVTVNGILYKSKIKHTSSENNFQEDIAKWDKVYASISPWVADKYYPSGTLVINDNKIYKCSISHIDGSTFKTVISSSTVWVEVSKSTIDNWTSNHDYSIDDMLVYNNRLYRVNAVFTSSTSFDATNLDIMSEGVYNWDSNTKYYQNQLILHDNLLYIVNTTFTSTTTFADTNMTRLTNKQLDDWSVNTEYLVGDTVVYNNRLFKCKTAHTSGTTFTIANWSLELNTSVSDWKSGTIYFSGEIIAYANVLYICTTTNTSSASFSADITFWKLLDSNIKNWEKDIYYPVDHLVINDGKIYKCKTANTDTTFTVANWTLLSSVFEGIKDWKASKDYSVDDLMVYNNTLYRCTIAHKSSTTLQPDIADWQLVYSALPAWKAETFYSIGVCVYNGSSIYVCKTAHTSGDTFVDDNWILLSSASSKITAWKTDNPYSVEDIVIYNDKLYCCKTAHTSTASFTNDILNWTELNQTVTDSTAYSQVTKIGVTAPKTVELVVPYTSTFCRATPDVLKFTAGATSKVVTENGFDNSDSGDFLIDGESAENSMYVEFGNNKDTSVESNGTMHLINKINVTKESSKPITISGVADGYVSTFVTMNFNTSLKSVTDWTVE